MAQAFLASDYAFSPSNRVVDTIERMRDVVINWAEQSAIIAADAEERGDNEAFDAAMRTFAAYRRVVDLCALELQREQGARQ